MKSKGFFGIAIALSLPVIFFFLDNIVTASILLLIIAGLIYATKIKKFKFDLALTIALALVFVFFLLGNIGLSNRSSIFINTSALDMGVIQSLFLKPTVWLATVGIYLLAIHSVYNYQKNIKPNPFVLFVPLIVLLGFALASVKISVDFIAGYLSY